MKPITIQHPLASTRIDRVDSEPPARTYEWRQMAGFGLIGLGVVAVAIGWFGVSGEAEPWKQMPYLASGGIGGAALIAIGVTCLISFEHASDRRVLIDVLDRLAMIESELDELRSSSALAPDGFAPEHDDVEPAPRRAPRRAVRKA